MHSFQSMSFLVSELIVIHHMVRLRQSVLGIFLEEKGLNFLEELVPFFYVDMTSFFL